jgi:hypothetical protein
VLYEGDEPGGERCAVRTAETGGERCAVRTAGRETGVQRCIPSVDGDKIVAVAVVQSETDTELGSLEPAVKCEKSNRAALIKLTNLGAISQFRKKRAELARSPVGSCLAQFEY